MKTGLAWFVDLVCQTLRAPRDAARSLLALDIPQGGGLAALTLVSVLYSLILQVLHLSTLEGPSEGEMTVFTPLLRSPFTTALSLFAAFVVMAVLVQVIGAYRGGKGRLDQSFLVIAWLQTVMVLAQFAMVGLVFVALLILPALAQPLATLLLPGLLVLLFWLLTHFVTELHGFKSPLRVFGGIVVSIILINLVLSLALSALFGPEAFTNV